MVRDFQKSRVYKWEDTHIISKDKSHVPFDQAQTIVDYIWKAEGKSHPPKIEEMSPRATTKLASATRLKIRIPKRGVKTTVLIHELAHSMTSTFEGESVFHNERYVGVYMELLSRYAGHDLETLKESADEAKIKYNFDGSVL